MKTFSGSSTAMKEDRRTEVGGGGVDAGTEAERLLRSCASFHGGLMVPG